MTLPCLHAALPEWPVCGLTCMAHMRPHLHGLYAASPACPVCGLTCIACKLPHLQGLYAASPAGPVCGLTCIACKLPHLHGPYAVALALGGISRVLPPSQAGLGGGGGGEGRQARGGGCYIRGGHICSAHNRQEPAGGQTGFWVAKITGHLKVRGYRMLAG